jgi:hypothetical protein
MATLFLLVLTESKIDALALKTNNVLKNKIDKDLNFIKYPASFLFLLTNITKY